MHGSQMWIHWKPQWKHAYVWWDRLKAKGSTGLREDPTDAWVYGRKEHNIQKSEGILVKKHHNHIFQLWFRHSLLSLCIPQYNIAGHKSDLNLTSHYKSYAFTTILKSLSLTWCDINETFKCILLHKYGPMHFLLQQATPEKALKKSQHESSRNSKSPQLNYTWRADSDIRRALLSGPFQPLHWAF